MERHAREGTAIPAQKVILYQNMRYKHPDGERGKTWARGGEVIKDPRIHLHCRVH